jgi:hypothetical protein
VQSQRPRKLVRASAGKSSLSISAQPLEFVVISDSEPEPEDDNEGPFRRSSKKCL